MLRIIPCLLSLSLCICCAFGAPRRSPWHGQHTADQGSSTVDGVNTLYGSPTIVTTPTTTTTRPGGQSYAQTTLPSTTTSLSSLALQNQRLANPTSTDTSTSTTGRATTGTTTGTATGPTGAAGSVKCYRLASDFPPSSQWVSLQSLIDTSRPDMVGSSNDGPDEADAAIAAVQSVSESAGLDPRIAFAMMMQESSGKVRPIVGDNGLSFGLFQVQNSAIPLCNDYAKNECPTDVITTQVEFGVFGHSGTGSPPVAPGIAYWLGAQGGDIGQALRGYNTGSIPDPNDLTNAGAATASYVSDVANRLTGALVGAQHQATCP